MTVRIPRQYRIRYFKPSGKWYLDAELNFVGIEYKAADEIRRLRRVGSLPGLTSGGWDGYILFEATDVDGSFPSLVLPE